MMSGDTIFEQFFEDYLDSLFQLDNNGLIVSINKMAEVTFGYTGDELVDKVFREFALTPRTGSDVLLVRHKHGQKVYCRSTSVPLHVNSEPVGTIVTLQDITEPYKRMKHLEDVNEVFTFISEKSQNIISSISPKGIFTYISPSVEDVLGYSPDEIIGRPATDFNHPDDNIALAHFHAQLSQNQETARFTGRVRRKNGEYRWFETTARYVRDASGSIVQTIGVGRDITERKSIDDLMLRAEKLAVAEQLAASMAHEIRNPLTAVLGFIQLLSSTEVEPVKRAEFYSLISSELHRADKVISDYLTFSSPDIERTEIVRVSDVIETAKRILSPYAYLNGVQIETVTTKAFVKVDTEKFLQVLVNLIKNAIEATAGSGTVEVGCKRIENHIEISVVDDGIGMTEEQLSRVGLPFYSTKDSGTGLGLMVSCRIIESMGGTIEVLSTLGQGSRFQINFPIHVA